MGDPVFDTALTWNDLGWLRRQTRLPILLKGILHPDDARLALEHGVDGIIVSNHGGRQVDGAIAALDALPAVVDAVGQKVPILFDSGIRYGATRSRRWRWGHARCCSDVSMFGVSRLRESKVCATWCRISWLTWI